MSALLNGCRRDAPLDEALKSRLSRLKTCLEAERRYWKVLSSLRFLERL